MKFRVVSVDYDAKTFVISPKLDSLSVPAIAMTLAQVGNFTNTERQTYIMIDSTLGNNNITFFDDCNTWDVEEYQEKSWFGKKKGRKVAGIDASVYSAVLKHVIMTGLIFQIDEISGDLVRVPLDKGAYVPDQRYAYYDRVSRNGALWLCVNEKGTTTAPASDSADWLKQVDKGTDGISITNHGAWRTAKTPIPKMGLVTMGGSSWLAKVETSNPPMWCITDNAGNRLMTEGGYLLTGETNDAEWELLVESGAPGKPGADGIGIPGKDGITYYTWMRYADDAQGNGMSNNPDGKSYMGLAYNKLTAIESETPADYSWSRFRGEDGTDGIGIPGKDGITYYTWLAYSDNSDGSNMYQVPTDNTRYVGIAVNKTTAAESSNPGDYTWSRFRGTDGTSITNHGVWRTAKTPIPKMGLVTMGGSSWLAKVETSNPPMWCITDNAGNRLMTESGYILTGETNDEEWEMIVENGSDSTSYWLTCPISAININSVGSLTPSSVLVSCKKKKGEGAVDDCSDYYLAARKYNGTWLAHVSATKSASIAVPSVAGYTQFCIRAYKTAAEAGSWGSGFVSEIGIGVVKDGASGQSGPAGSFPRDRGEFVAGTSYVWSPSYRDKILYPFGGVYYNFLVANYGATVTAAPTSANGDAQWEAMGKYKSIATDTVFAEGANVARFMFKNGILRSQDETDGTPNLELDGKTGKIKGCDVELSGKIEAKEDSKIAGMTVVGNSLRGVQAIMGIYKHQISGNGSVADRDIIVNNILQQQTYLFSITSASNDIQVRLPSHHDMMQKGIEQYQFEITIVLDNGSTGSAILFRCNDDALIVHGLKSFSTYGLGKGGVLKLLYFQNRYYLVSNSYAQTSPW